MPNRPSSETGFVVSLWRDPVKSMLGEEVQATSVTHGGLLGDRVYAVIEQSPGKVASAKAPRTWGTLLDCRAALSTPPHPGEPIPPVRLTRPDGTLVTRAQEHVHACLSRILERAVTLTTTRPASPRVDAVRLETVDAADTLLDIGAVMMPGRFADSAAVPLRTTATLDRRHPLSSQGRFAAQRFRPPSVVEPPAGQPDGGEHPWVGHTLAMGAEVRVRMTDPCARCVMTTLPPGRSAARSGDPAHRGAAQPGAYPRAGRRGAAQGGCLGLRAPRRYDPPW